MKYIRIKNSGCIEPQALHLVGASTKRNDSSKIGQFGSGNKYALAYLLRSGYEIRIFSGEKEIKVETKEEKFRDNVFNLIYIDGEKTSITSEMGKDWKFWQAIREIYCNALDEGGSSLDFVQEIAAIEGETHFYIDVKTDVMEFMQNFDNYFATKKEVLFECKQGRILKKTGDKVNIYRKGIRCYEANKTSTFDYDFNEITIDENRLVSYFWQVEEKIWDLIYQCTDREIIMQALHNSKNPDFLEACISDISTINSSNCSDVFRNAIKSINLAPAGYAGLLKPDEINNHVIVPTKVFQSFRGIISDDNVGDKFKITKGGGIFREIETSPLYDATIKEALAFLKDVGFEVPYEIVVSLFDDKRVMGCAYDGKIILSDICIEKGVNEVVNTIIEEFIHIKYQVYDETRGFQTAIITEFISYMKKANAYAI